MSATLRDQRVVAAAVILALLLSGGFVLSWWDLVSREAIARERAEALESRRVDLAALRARVVAVEAANGEGAMSAETIPAARAKLQSDLRRVIASTGGTLIALNDDWTPNGQTSQPVTINTTLRLRAAATDLARLAIALEGLPGSALIRASITPLRDPASNNEVRAVLRVRVEVKP